MPLHGPWQLYGQILETTWRRSEWPDQDRSVCASFIYRCW
jgi:hypothetical protein